MNDYINAANLFGTATAEPQTEIKVPTLHEAAVLVSLSMSVPTLSKLDRGASDEVTRNKRADKGTARVNKSLINRDHLKEITKLRDAARNYHYAETVPWGDLGNRLLTNEKLIDYQNKMAGFERDFNSAKTRFLDKWDTLKMSAQMELGDLYNPDEYPSRHRLAGKFRFHVALEPVPQPGAIDDIRTNLSDTVRAEMKRQYEQLMQTRSREVAMNIWKRLYGPLKNMSERLDDKEDDGTPNKFRATLVDNVLEIVDLMKAFNLTNDPDMDRVRRELRNTLSGVTTEGLKNNVTLRKTTKQGVDNIIKTVEQIGGLDW